MYTYIITLLCIIYHYWWGVWYTDMMLEYRVGTKTFNEYQSHAVRHLTKAKALGLYR